MIIGVEVPLWVGGGETLTMVSAAMCIHGVEAGLAECGIQILGPAEVGLDEACALWDRPLCVLLKVVQDSDRVSGFEGVRRPPRCRRSRLRR